MKRALITGITGQDGSYLAEFLLNKGYAVHGIVRRASSSNLVRIAHLLGNERLILHEGDMSDQASLTRAIELAQPEEVYNLAAMSHVKMSFSMPEYALDVDGLGVLRILEAMRQIGSSAKFYQASTSELFGKIREVPQSESTPFYPRSPYGAAKLYAYWITVNYRESYEMYACNGILFNHESPRRGEDFVSRKITLGVAKIKAGLQDKLVLGNLDAKRDWGYAADFVEGMWLMLQQEQPEDFVLATGKATSVRQFVEWAFAEVGISIVWKGQGIKEIGIDERTGKAIVEVSSEYFRPAEVDFLLGNPAKAEQKLKWTPKTSVQELVKLMIQADIEVVERLILPV